MYIERERETRLFVALAKPVRKTRRGLAGLLVKAMAAVLCGITWWPVAAAGSDAQLEAGRRLYEEGLLVDDRELVAQWPLGVAASGRAAACVACHRRSGQGTFEGENVVPPVTAPALYGPPRPSYRRLVPGIRFEDFHFRARPPYSRRSLSRALADGVTPGGHRLSPLMPRYRISARDLAALDVYLRQLSARPSPGIDGRTVHFATVTTPTARTDERDAMWQVLQACFDERFPATAASGTRWVLHAWSLSGDAADWPRQLEAYATTRPVFALVSGLGSADWKPIHDHCERQHTPCLFPLVDVPGAAAADTYSFYFSDGPWLEAVVMDRWLQDEAMGVRPQRVVQLVLEGSAVAHQGAQAFASAAGRRGLPVTTTAVAVADDGRLALVSAQLRPDDAVVLWLDPATQRALMSEYPQGLPVGRVLGSGWMADPSQLAPPEAWREQLRIVYPFDPPARRELRARFNLRPWLQARGLRTDPRLEAVQGNALTACNLLAEGMAAMRGVPTREQLVELIEHYPAAMGNAPAPQSFSSFSLGPGQRRSSKGAYIVRYAAAQGSELAPVSGWITPD